MKVVATQMGYYDGMRRYPADSGNKRAGQPFDLKDPKDFSKRWMRVVEEPIAPAAEEPASPAPPPIKSKKVI